jgi:HK97 family phage portal protein
MAWNSSSNKSIGGARSKALNPGAPVAYNPSQVGKPYRDSWDIERAYREGFQKVTWVNRCIDAIAGNQSRLPVVLRENNDPAGRIVRKSDRKILDILNTKSNMGENSFVFRYRLSSQLLMSSRGAFIEKIRGRDGELMALQLLPPQHTAPIPDPKKFVSGYEVDMRNGTKVVLKPEDVVWIRKPHPLDPYLSLTPMESAGIAIEIENLSKIYNRNFLLNDGRPGGLLVVRGEIDDDDKDELRSRFRGNINRAGAVTVVSSDEGVDFVDTGQSPRDANYVQMRQIQKEEILAAFGVPESVIGNAAGRTFSNAAEEHKVFWNETMLPHLETIARGLDELDEQFYIDFDVTDVPVLVLYKQERDRYLMSEYQTGLISGNEYREGAGRKIIDSELMDAMLSNPNLTPIGYTNKKWTPTQPPGAPGAPPAGAPGGPMVPGVPGATQPIPPIPGAPESEIPAEGMTAAMNAEAIAEAQATQMGQASAFDQQIRTKSLHDEWDVKAEESFERWIEILDSSLERFIERQQRVILEKASGSKSRKALEAGNLDPENIFDQRIWDKQLNEDMRPILSGIMNDATMLVGQETGMPAEMEESESAQYLNEQIERFQKINETTAEEIAAATLIASSLGNGEDKMGMLKAALIAIFVNLLSKRKRTIAEHEAHAAFNAGSYMAGRSVGAATKTWVSEKDAKVRPEHAVLHGNTVPVYEPFSVGGQDIRFPGDPSAPMNLTMNCRCKVRFGF